MWELSCRHSCATCRFSQKNGCIAETSFQAGKGGPFGEDALFPLLHNLICLFHRESLGEPGVQAVLVRPDGRCAAYECHEERYLAVNGSLPGEDEALYALVPPSGGRDAVFHTNL